MVEDTQHALDDDGLRQVKTREGAVRPCALRELGPETDDPGGDEGGGG